ncbi:basal body-orientation factor 1-like [Megalops cyprinoides]|uniref:basal body-orientation factor 1-like n=1 Tax=Megalops cyprinoides TaxID=118141 RepID=UPI0018645058|nr:basal body-orientation factor 1-like [Megalops cyprinoides]
MPKKKGKKGKKGKGKGKKDGKQESKADKESDIEKAKANAALWEARLDVTERSRVEYREAARKLARANEELTNQQYRAEKDTLDIIGFMKRTDIEKEEKISQLENQLREQKNKAREDSEQLVAEYTQRINELEEKFNKRSDEFRMIQGELKMIKEFRKKKAHMEQELRDIKESMHLADKAHKESLSRMEHKFFSEKLRLEKEAEQRIAQLAERAHSEAIVQLDDASRSVFKENIRLNEALSYHMKETEEMRKLTATFAEENESLLQHKETIELMLKENVSQLKEQREEIAELKGKVFSLEQALGLMAGEFERESQETQQRALVSAESGRVEIAKLQRTLAMREQEMNRVKRLARGVVEQRTEVERFFQDALAQVKREIQASRAQQRQADQQMYLRQIAAARAGHREYPPIRSFGKNQHSTNCVYGDLEEAEKWAHLHGTKVDISELTWEQKEQVLRLLFAKMNGLKTSKPTQPPALSESSERNHNRSSPTGVMEEPSHGTFITQAPVSSQVSEPRGLPDIKTM